LRGKNGKRRRKKEDYHLHERRFGSFEPWFAVPEGVDTDKIGASVKNGILTIRLSKTQEAMKQAKKIEVKTS